MKKITAEDFKTLWLSFIDEIIMIQNWKELWNSSGAWTRATIGDAKSSEQLSPIGNYLKTKIPDLKYMNEDAKFDLTATTGQFIKQIATIKGGDFSYYDSTESEFFPTIYDILIEQENEIYTCWREIAKLAYTRSYLKVLITFNSDNLSTEDLKMENEMVFKNAESIIEQCSNDFTESYQTEYLILIGNLTQDKIEWNSKTFSKMFFTA